jgi:ABC-2 type transport system permease protein
VLSETRWEQVTFWRQPASVVFTAVFPLMVLVFVSVFARKRIDYLGGIRPEQYLLPAVLSFTVMSASFTALAMSQAIRRETGQLKRLRATPLPAGVYFAALVLNSVLVSVALCVPLTVVGVLVFGAQLYPARVPALLLTAVVGACSFSALGLLVAALVPSRDAAPAMVNGLLFPLLFLSGSFYPFDPHWLLARIMDWLPVRPFTLAMFHGFDPRLPGSGVDLRDLLVVAAWGAIGCVLAMRLFSWEPRAD